MEYKGMRTWIALGFLGLVMFFAVTMQLMHERTGLVPAVPGFSYVMPRLKNYEQPISFRDLMIERIFNGKPAPTKPETVAQADAKKKAEEAKKSKAQNLKKKAEQAQAQKKMSVETTNTNQETANFGLDPLPGSAPQTADLAPYVQPAVASAAKTETEDKEKEKEEELELTLSQWRALLQNAPNSQNVAKLLRAKAAGKIDATGFYTLVHELLTDSAEDRRKAGLALLDGQINGDSFEFMVTEVSLVHQDLQIALKIRLDQYSEPAYLSSLQKVLLTSPNDQALIAALEQISQAWTAFKNQEPNPDVSTQVASSRQLSDKKGLRRNAVAYSQAQFMAFIPALTRVKQQSGTSSQYANQLFDQIRQGQQVATADFASEAPSEEGL